MYSIEYAESVADDLGALRPFDRAKLLDQIDRRLANEPARETRNQKIVVGLKPPWEHEDPLWQLRIGEFRVFYDVDEPQKQVIVRAIRRKPPHKTTEEIL